MDYSEPCQYSVRLVERLKSLDTETTLDFDLIQGYILTAIKLRKNAAPKTILIDMFFLPQLKVI